MAYSNIERGTKATLPTRVFLHGLIIFDSLDGEPKSISFQHDSRAIARRRDPTPEEYIGDHIFIPFRLEDNFPVILDPRLLRKNDRHN